MTEETKVQRRTITKGAAWAVPVVAVGAAAPAFAASGEPTFAGQSCKEPGASHVKDGSTYKHGYRVYFDNLSGWVAVGQTGFGDPAFIETRSDHVVVYSNNSANDDSLSVIFQSTFGGDPVTVVFTTTGWHPCQSV